MTIQEAIKSGKRFCRKGRAGYYHAEFLYLGQLEIDDIIAEDWEVEEEKITITKSALADELHKYIYKKSYDYDSFFAALGFKS